MRKAELVMAIVMAIFSAYLMWKSAELPIGWIKDEGPGGGFWPFWLAAAMLASCLWIIFRWVKKTSPLSQSTEIYMDAAAFRGFVEIAGSLIVTVGLFHFIGIYGALPLFLIFHIRYLGKHSWAFTGMMAVVTPVVTFLFFEIVLKITLPKGLTDEYFYPIFALFA
jgi:putative tricarboxylic transport membrane protein